MRFYFTLVLAMLSSNCFSQEILPDFIGPLPPTSSFFIPPGSIPCLNPGIHTAMPFMGFGHSCIEQRLNQIRVVAPMMDGIVNSDQNPALLQRNAAYQSVKLALTPWQINSNLNLYSTALMASVQKQFRNGGSWSIRYENFNLLPLITPSRGFFSEIPALSSLFRLAYATPLSKHWSVGFAAKYGQREISNNAFFIPRTNNGAWAADLGLRYHNSKDISNWQKLNWQWGFSLTNLGSRVASEIVEGEKQYLPTAISMGFLLEEEFLLRTASVFRIRGTYQLNKLLVPNPCPNCDNDSNGIHDIPTQSAWRGIFSSFSDAPDGFRGEFNEINHQFDMSVFYQFNDRFSVNAKASLFYQHPTMGSVQYVSTDWGVRWRSIHFNLTYWRPNVSRSITFDPQLGMSLGYQHFFTAQ